MDDEHESRNTSRHSQLLSQVLDENDTDMDEESPKGKNECGMLPSSVSKSVCSLLLSSSW